MLNIQRRRKGCHQSPLLLVSVQFPCPSLQIMYTNSRHYSEVPMQPNTERHRHIFVLRSYACLYLSILLESRFQLVCWTIGINCYKTCMCTRFSRSHEDSRMLRVARGCVDSPYPIPILPRELFDILMVRMLELHRKPWQITKHARGLSELLASPSV